VARAGHAVTPKRISLRTLLSEFIQGEILIRQFTKSLSAVAVLATTVILGASAATAANQNASNSADSGAANAAQTYQHGNQGQNADSSSGNSGCWEFCTGGGGNLNLQSQSLGQASFTNQWADSLALAKQDAINANVPVNIGGSGKGSGSSSANQNLSNSANSEAANAAATKQQGNQDQNANSSSGNDGCSKFCTGGGGNINKQSQDLAQLSKTQQQAASAALAKQNAINANVPVTIGSSKDSHDQGWSDKGWGSDGWGKSGKGSGANQNAHNSASSAAANASATTQTGNQHQNSDTSSGNDGHGGKFSAGGGGNITPQAQDLVQLAKTQQGAISAGLAAQFATNGASPVSIGG